MDVSLCGLFVFVVVFLSSGSGVLLVMLGLIQYLGPVYSAIIVIAIYFGIKKKRTFEICKRNN